MPVERAGDQQADPDGRIRDGRSPRAVEVRGRSSKMQARLLRPLLRPFGHLAFVAALCALSATRRLLGEEDDLGFFAGRLGGTVWRYPEVTRLGVEIAWVVWLTLFALALSPLDPITSRWDEVGLAVLALFALWRQRVAVRQAGY